MMLLEHDAKQLLAERGLPVPAGLLLRSGDPVEGDGPAMVKAQVPVGGRGKEGGIKLARDRGEIEVALGAILGMTIKGHGVRACRVEEPIDHVAEAYFSLSIDAGPGNVRLLVSAEGGVDIEASASDGALLSAAADPDLASVRAAIGPLAAALPERLRGPVIEAGQRWPTPFSPTRRSFSRSTHCSWADGSWVIGDAKMVVDDNAFRARKAEAQSSTRRTVPRGRALLSRNTTSPGSMMAISACDDWRRAQHAADRRAHRAGDGR